MQCPHCQQENPSQAKFCLACGRQLRRTCSGCGTELPGHARYCIECGQSTELPAGSAAGPAEPPLPAAPPVAAGPARVILDRDEVLDALYHQGCAALRRSDRAGAAAALAPVVAEAPERYPDAAAQLAQAQRPGPGGARNASRGQNPTGRPDDAWRRGATHEGSSWAAAIHALGAVLALRARHVAGSPRLRPLRGRLATLAGPHGRRAWAVGALIGAVVLFVLFAERSGPTDTRAAGTPEAAPVPTVVPDAEVFARCDAAVAASNWADGVRECRTLQARDPDYAGLADKLAAAYVGRGQQRLAQGDDLDTASADFEEALRFQPESTDAQTAFQRLYLYREGDKALGDGDWETAVAQLGADYADAPDYLQNLADRSLEAKLFAAWLGWGHAALAVDDNLSAAQRCSQALTLSPDDPDAQGCVDAARTAMGFD